MDNNARHIRWRISLSLSISFLGWWKKTYKKIMCVCVCVCVREREREREILRDSKGKFAMGRKKTEQNKNKVQSQIENQTKKQCRKLTKLEKKKAYRVFVDCSCCCCGEEEEKDCWRERR